MLANRPLEAGVLIAFLLTIGFCSRIDPALSDTVADNETDAHAVAIPVGRRLAAREAKPKPDE